MNEENLLNQEIDTQDEFIEIPTPDFDKTYKNIKHLIFDGFIPVKVKYGSHRFTLKGLFSSEINYIDLITNTPEEKVPFFFLYSIIMFDNLELYKKRADLHQNFSSIFNSLPARSVDRIYSLLISIQRYYLKSLDKLEAYLYEHESRHQWRVYKHRIINTGIIGFKEIGYNTAQETWILFNQREDEKEKLEADFSQSKFIASSMVGSKEIQKIERMEKLREKEEKKRRQNIRLKGKETKLKLTESVNTAEELLKALDRQIRGEKDLHDRIIEEHERQILFSVAERKRQIQEIKTKEIMPPWRDKDGSMPIPKEEMENKIREISQYRHNYKGNPNEEYASKLSRYVKNPPEELKEEEKKENNKENNKPKKSIFDSEIQDELKKKS